MEKRIREAVGEHAQHIIIKLSDSYFYTEQNGSPHTTLLYYAIMQS